MKTVCVLGLGYIGLPTAAILATNGFKVAGIDINEKVVNTIQKGEIHIKEQNTFRDVNIALANELCKIACYLNLNALEIIKLANMHLRVNLHQPGPRVGVLEKYNDLGSF